jgi:hypothetical protein
MSEERRGWEQAGLSVARADLELESLSNRTQPPTRDTSTFVAGQPRRMSKSHCSRTLSPLHSQGALAAIESPDAKSAETQSRKSESFALDALSPLWTRDRAGGTAPRRLRASPMPKVQTGIHSWQAERLTGTWIPVESGITGLASVTAVDLASHPP